MTTETMVSSWNDILPKVNNTGIYHQLREQFLYYEIFQEKFIAPVDEQLLLSWYKKIKEDLQLAFSLFSIEKLHYIPFTVVFPENILLLKDLMYEINLTNKDGIISTEVSKNAKMFLDDYNTDIFPYLIFATDISNRYKYQGDEYKATMEHFDKIKYRHRSLILREALSVALLQPEYFHSRFRGLQIGGSTIRPKNDSTDSNVFIYRLGTGNNARLRIETIGDFFYDEEFPIPTTCILV
ncbi:MAG: hypothetical protein WCO58_00050 [bacterium]